MKISEFKKVKIEPSKYWYFKYIFLYTTLIYLLYKSYSDNKFIGCFFVICTIFAHILYLKKYFYLRLQKRNIEKKIRFLVEQNNWYTNTYLPDIRYKITKDFLYIVFNLDGSAKSKQYRDLETQISDCFDLSCNDIQKINSFVVYFLVDDSYYNPLKIDESTDYTKLCTREKIMLNNNQYWNWRIAPHSLITGGTGSGKTFFLLYLLKCFKSLNFGVKIIDPKKADLYKLGNAWEIPSACEDNQIAKILRDAQEKMNRRYLDMKQIGVDYYTLGLEPIFIVFDEAMSFYGGSGDKKVKEECKKYLLDIVVKGRQAGINIILSSQRGDCEYLGGGAVRDQLGFRVALGNMSKTGLGMVFGNDFNDIRPRFTGKGEGLIFVNDGTMQKPMDYKAPRMNSGVWDIN